MSRINKVLGALLVAQVALGFVTWVAMAPRSEKSGSSRPAFDFDVARASEIEITGKPANPGDEPNVVHLVLRDGGWVLPDRDDYPADKEKVDKVLDELKKLKLGAVIASRPANHGQLKVSDADRDRKVILKSGDKTATVFLGSGAAETVNARFDGKDEVYRGWGLSVWQINTSVRNYVDTKYVKVEADKLQQAAVTNQKGRLTFARDKDTWSLAELESGATLDENRVKSFINKLAELDMEEPINKAISAEQGLEGGDEVVLVYTEDGNPVTRRFVVGAKRDDRSYYVKSDGSDWVVAASKWAVEDIKNKTAADFAKKTE